jgi:hypothetical protein
LPISISSLPNNCVTNHLNFIPPFFCLEVGCGFFSRLYHGRHSESEGAFLMRYLGGLADEFCLSVNLWETCSWRDRSEVRGRIHRE